jgi:mRNA interferase RelE/StbE
LAGHDKLYRITAGPGRNYRVVYEIRDQALIVLIIRVGDRKEVYRRLG